MKLFKKHRVRATFYHITAIISVLTIVGHLQGLISAQIALWVSFAIIIIDYVAEMLDPHPDAPGPLIKKYFHRAFDDEGEE